MKLLSENKVLGAVLIVGALAAGVVLEVTHNQVPAIVAMVVTAGLGLVTGQAIGGSGGGNTRD